MFLLIKSILGIGIGILTTLFVLLGMSPDKALAPDVSPPAIFEGADSPKSPSAAPSTTTVALEQSADDAEDTSPIKKTNTADEGAAPLIDNYMESLQYALDALEKIKQQQPEAVPEQELNERVRGTVVNILCIPKGESKLNPISASGVIIDSRGIIITNAHVAQYFLLKDYPSRGVITCIARTGSPAMPAYTLELLFLPPSWIAKNAQKINDTRPTGNGEHDYAFLRTSGFIAAAGIPVPAEFPYLPVAKSAPNLGDATLLAGYPAGFLEGNTIQNDLYATSAYAHIQQLYTFGNNMVDLFSIGGSVVAQRGSSGGAVASEGGALVGVIVTSSDAASTANRDLRALSTEYIIRDFEAERGVSLAEYLGRNLAEEARLFESNIAPTLTQALVEVLEN